MLLGYGADTRTRSVEFPFFNFWIAMGIVRKREHTRFANTA